LKNLGEIGDELPSVKNRGGRMELARATTFYREIFTPGWYNQPGLKIFATGRFLGAEL
jgi:hypothetical protein